MLNKWAPAPVAKPAVVARAVANAPAKADKQKVAILRRKELGNNCKFIADAYDDGMEIITPDTLKKMDWIVRWGTTTPIGQVNDNANVINKASAITQTSNKGVFRLLAHKEKLTPRTWANLDDLGNEKEPPEAVIIRTMHHERSENITLCHTFEEANKAIAATKGHGYYISEYIKKDEEYRVFVAQGRAFMVFRKRPKDKNAVSWGCVEEGAMEYVNWSQWPLAVVENAIKAFNLSNLDFGAADIIVKDGKAYFLEINTAPEVWPYYGERFADVIKYIINVSRDRIKTVFTKDWKNYIHPAISEKAIV